MLLLSEKKAHISLYEKLTSHDQSQVGCLNDVMAAIILTIPETPMTPQGQSSEQAQKPA